MPIREIARRTGLSRNTIDLQLDRDGRLFTASSLARLDRW